MRYRAVVHASDPLMSWRCEKRAAAGPPEWWAQWANHADPVLVQLIWRSHDPHPAPQIAVALLAELYREEG